MARTKGARNIDDIAIQHPSRCRACGSTEREPYSNRDEEECITTIGEGIPITHIIRQQTRCKTCGQARIDRTFENRPESTPGKPYSGLIS